jgi:hypothetical protein
LQAKDGDQNNQREELTNVWSGSNMFLDSIDEYESRVRLVSITQVPLNNALRLCKMHNITLTGLLNGLLVIYLAKATPARHSFRAIVPYSMRHVTKAADDEMCNHASGMLSEYPESLVAELRNLTENSAQALELIVKLAHEFARRWQPS